ncbi:hypothetical protein [Nocardioides rubriscoriae]|uniref:hypothetical protein n=1 Tax=Nocardioides rubriscoriae TaxID=642762 RepID=UPI0011DFC978|nr:hypothetical protein [Nocardioides rubriscoriae]
MTITSHTPEVLYADTTSRIASYRGLARRYAAEGNAFGAVSATWAADINTVQAIMWERVMIASPTPDQQFFDIATTVARALATYALHPPAATTAVEAVRAARDGLSAAFDPAAQSLMERRLSPLDHLEGLPAPTAAEVAEVARQRLGGATVAEASAERTLEARHYMATALELVREGRVDDALPHAWQADWATFEAYLLDAAAAVGDDSLISVDLRWAFAVDATNAIESLSADFADAVSTVRSRLADSLGSIEGRRLRERFEPISA